MDPSSSILLVCIIILLIFSSLASALETAITACSFIKIKSLAETNNKHAKEAKETLLLQDLQPKIITTMLIFNNIVNLTASTLTTVFTERVFGNAFIALGAGILMLIILVFGEIIPKNISVTDSENIVISFRKVILLLYYIFRPLAFILNIIVNLFLRIFNINTKKDEETFTEDELKTIVDISHEEGIIEKDEKEIIKNVFEFGDTELKDIIVPKEKMVSIDVNTKYDDILKIFKTERYTRIPIYDINHKDIVGILNIKDFLLRDIDENGDLDLIKIMRPPVFLYENRKIKDALSDMKRSNNGLCIVLDEHGDLKGLVTLEDILEELVGDIDDEYD